MPEARDAFYAELQRMNDLMGARNGPYYMGPNVSMVDLVLAPRASTLLDSCPLWRGEVARDPERFPALVTWMEAMEELPEWRFVSGQRGETWRSCR